MKNHILLQRGSGKSISLLVEIKKHLEKNPDDKIVFLETNKKEVTNDQIRAH